MKYCTSYYTLQKKEKEKLLNEEGSQLVSFSPDKQTIVVNMEEDFSNVIPIIKKNIIKEIRIKVLQFLFPFVKNDLSRFKFPQISSSAKDNITYVTHQKNSKRSIENK